MHLDMEVVNPSTAAEDEISQHMQLREVMKQNNFYLGDWYQEWHSYLSLCAPDTSLELAPRILTAGSLSSQAELFGEAWASNVHNVGQTPIHDLEAEVKVVAGYKKALREGLSDIERHEALLNINGTPELVVYTKTVSWLRTKKDKWLFLYFGTLDRETIH